MPLPAHSRCPCSALLALAVPVGKLLLVGAPSAQRWVAAGPRAREPPRRPGRGAPRCWPPLTLAVIGLALAAVALLAPVPTGARPERTASSAVYHG